MGEYVEKVRQARKRPAVLKLKVLSVRASNTEIPVIVFEGRTDIGPYEVWIRQIDPGFRYQPIPGEGKQQLLEFSRYLLTDAGKELGIVACIVDRDFDDLRGVESLDHLYCLPAYSYENLLITPQVVRSILHDELQCAEDSSLCETLAGQYEQLLVTAIDELRDVNFRLFSARYLGVKVAGKEERINRFLSISLTGVSKIYDGQELERLIPLEREFTEEEKRNASTVFDQIQDGSRYYRGKYLLAFFQKWITLLGEDRRTGATIFPETRSVPFSAATLTPRSLASRVRYPEGLDDFVANLKAA